VADIDPYDLVVVGTGGAAMAAGIEARKRARRVALVEHGPLGGTCLNVGCVPSKALLAAMGQRHRAAANPFAGIVTLAGAVDLRAVMEQKRGLIERMRQAKYADVAAAHGFPTRYGHASFDSPELLLVDGDPMPAGAYVIATGAEPAVPSLPGLAGVDYLTSTTAMEQKTLPTSMIVVGGGYVGLEQAQLWAYAGVVVTQVGRVAPSSEPELADVLRAVFTDDGIDLVEEHATAVEGRAEAVTVTTETGRAITAERLLVATGRQPHTDGLALDRAGVDIDDRGFVRVDEHQRTSNSKVYAAGDVSGGPQFVYVAARAGHVAAANALGDDKMVDYTGLPSVVFTTPQLASAGLTEEQALAAGYACDCRVLSARDVPRALANEDIRGALKLVAEAGTGRVLGVHAALDGAGEVMLAATYAIKARMTVTDIVDTWAPYLTMSEALRLAAGLFLDDKPTSCCA
jgi:mercuric reductase